MLITNSRILPIQRRYTVSNSYSLLNTISRLMLPTRNRIDLFHSYKIVALIQFQKNQSYMSMFFSHFLWMKVSRNIHRAKRRVITLIFDWFLSLTLVNQFIIVQLVEGNKISFNFLSASLIKWMGKMGILWFLLSNDYGNFSQY